MHTQPRAVFMSWSLERTSSIVSVHRPGPKPWAGPAHVCGSATCTPAALFPDQGHAGPLAERFSCRLTKMQSTRSAYAIGGVADHRGPCRRLLPVAKGHGSGACRCHPASGRARAADDAPRRCPRHRSIIRSTPRRRRLRRRPSTCRRHSRICSASRPWSRCSASMTSLAALPRRSTTWAGLTRRRRFGRSIRRAAASPWRSAMARPSSARTTDCAIRLMSFCWRRWICARRSASTHESIPLSNGRMRTLGYPGSYLNDRLVEVIDLLLATPEIDAPVQGASASHRRARAARASLGALRVRRPEPAVPGIGSKGAPAHGVGQRASDQDPAGGGSSPGDGSSLETVGREFRETGGPFFVTAASMRGPATTLRTPRRGPCRRPGTGSAPSGLQPRRGRPGSTSQARRDRHVPP